MSFQQGLSGLSASSTALDVVGNNIANSSTVGFKSSSGHFADVYAASLTGGGASQVGIGTSLSSVFQQFTQGTITTTNNPLDIAINGDGFYEVVRGGLTGYTRNGQFHTDNEGYIVNDQDFRLMGYQATSTGQILPQIAEIKIDTSNVAPRATGAAAGGDATMVLNLDSGESVPTVTPFNYTNPLSYNFTTSMTLYDTLGVDHSMTLFFAKNVAAGQWDVYATLDGASPASVGGLNFDTSGKLTTAMPMALPAGWAVTTGAATPLGSGQPNWNINFSGSTSYAGDSTVNSKTQGGYAQGELSDIAIGADGVVLGKYTNGQTKALAQIALTTFANPNGLLNVGNNLFQSSALSGQAMTGAPGAGARGVLQADAVESSNVDLTAELVNLIMMQRNYQANAQTIKTQDAILQTLVNLR